MDTWYEEDLEILQSEIQKQIEAEHSSRGEANIITDEQMRNMTHLRVRVATPLHQKLGPSSPTGQSGTLWVIQLKFEFSTPTDTRFVFAKCRAFLEPRVIGEPAPHVYDIYPQHLYEGNPRNISLKFSPSIKVFEVEGSVGELSTNIQIGRITPRTVGFIGDPTKKEETGDSTATKDRSPYWELMPLNTSLIGIQCFWLAVIQPDGCTGISLRARVDGVVQKYWGLVPVGPKQRLWESRPPHIIS